MSEPRYCTSCCRTRPVTGGKYKVSANGLTRRWLCGDCVAKKPGSWFGSNIRGRK